MHSRHERDLALAEELGALALAGDLDAACLLGVIEAPHAHHSNLDANPEAAAIYRVARAVERHRLEVEYDEHADRIAHALL